MGPVEDFDFCYRAAQAKDPRFDGWFFTAVTSTGIYCRPSCPAMTPKRANVRFYPTAAAAQAAGFRACMRCRPDASPGSPEWNQRADAVARAMRLIADGVVDREGVHGLARRLDYSERQLQRVLVAEVGTGALALARAQRAQTARILIETTDLSMAHVAFAGGFASVRQFNDTVRAVFAKTPSALRAGSRHRVASGSGAISLLLAHRKPYAADAMFGFLAARTVPSLEAFVDGAYRRSLRLPHGEAVVELSPEEGGIRAVLSLEDLRDLSTAVSRCRRLLDLDADPEAVDHALSSDPMLGSLVRAGPGRRVPGAVDGFEVAVRVIIGQQVSVAGARTVARRLIAHAGRPLATARPPVTHTFPGPEEILAADPAAFAMPAARRRAILALATAVAAGDLRIDPGVDPVELEARLVALPGIGPWTSACVVMRALGNPDAFLPTDLGVRHALTRLGHPDDTASIVATAERWRPWRAYATAHLWSTLEKGTVAA
ncbi:MAG TPA: AlkA N-terminal domain-containing protein [Acidimicrobiales bacterium]|nr:AlkA N-terminal domain-containing protein [Acidimicrobiales bacterium]